MRIELNNDDIDHLRALDNSPSDNDTHQAICGYIGGGKQTKYANINLGEDFINALSIYAYENNTTIEHALRLIIDEFINNFINRYNYND